jgi:hypothetical protein
MVITNIAETKYVFFGSEYIIKTELCDIDTNHFADHICSLTYHARHNCYKYILWF